MAKRLPRTSLWILLAMSAGRAEATDPGPGFANCSITAKQDEQLRSKLDDDTRLLTQEQLFQEVRDVMKELGNAKTTFPVAFLKTCYKNKSLLLRKNFALATPAARDSFKMHWILGQLHELDGDNSDALVEYRAALKRDPQHYQAQQHAYNLWLKQELDTLGKMDAKALDLARLQRFVTMGNEFLLPIVQNPEAPKDQKIAVLRDRAAMLTKFNRRAEAAVDFKRILDIDANNTSALRELAAFEIARTRMADARIYLQRLAVLEPKNAGVLTNLVKLQVRDEDYKSCVSSLQAAKAAGLEDTADTLGQQSFCLAKSGRIEEAQKLNQAAVKKDPKNAFALVAQSVFREKNSDDLMKANQPGRALGELNEALKLNPNENRLRRKMALLVYDFQRAADFKPIEAATKDMNRVTELLASSLQEDTVESPILQVMSSAAAHSDKPAAGAPACDRQTKDYGTPPDIDFVLDCMKAYKAAGQVAVGRKMAQDALKLPRFKAGEARIYQALQTLR